MTPSAKKRRARSPKVESYAEWEARIEASVESVAREMKRDSPSIPPLECEPVEDERTRRLRRLADLRRELTTHAIILGEQFEKLVELEQWAVSEPAEGDDDD